MSKDILKNVFVKNFALPFSLKYGGWIKWKLSVGDKSVGYK